MSIILKAENISKQYRLGLVGSTTIKDDARRLWASMRGKEDPFLKVGAVNDRSSKAEQDYVWALKDVNFEVKHGEVLGIIGKNGAGKSTLLKILSRVTSPTTGSIKTRGRIASLLEIGTGFHPELTGRENIFMNGAVLGMTKSEIKSKLDEIIDFSGCEKYIDTPVKRYSSGMTVRLGFAVAAHLEPEILVVDEVLAVGDAEFQKKAIGKMQDLSTGEGRTVLFVSHNMASIKSLCDRAILLKHGNNVFEGDTGEVVNAYLKKNEPNEKVKDRLLERTDRIGSGELKIKNLKFINDKNIEVQSCLSGEELNIVVYLKKMQIVQYEKLIVSIAFQDENKNTILLFSSDEMAFNFKRLMGFDSFKLKIPSLLLRGGYYSLRIVIAEGGTQRENLIDVIDNIAFIHILQGDIYKVGNLNRKLNQALIPGKYEI